MSERVQRRLAAILVADIVGYSRLIEVDEEGTRARLRSLHADFIEPKISADGGRIVKTTGDGFLVEFPSAVDAVRSALAIQTAMPGRDANLPEDRQIAFRVGINIGDVIVEGDDIHGDGVNVAARLEAMCEPGLVYVSGSVFEQVTGKLDAGFEDLGEHTVKNIGKPIRVYRISQEAGPESVSPAASDLDKLLDRPAIAVLPFENISGDPDQEYFADGLTEDIITALSLWKSFPVIARNSTFAFKGQSRDIRKVGAELGARYVIEGSVRKGGERVRITAQLIDAETGHHVWAERYDSELSEIFELQDELTGKISAIVAPELERAEDLRLKATDRQNLDAWDWVLRGLAHLNEITVEGNIAARENFKRAVERDPAYSRAWSNIARSHFRDIVLGATASIGDTVAQGFAIARKAVELDRSDSLAHEVLGIGHVMLGEFEPAISEAERAIELNPSNASAYSNLGYDLTVAGRPLEAIPQIERGLALNPKDQRIAHYFSFLALAHLGARQHDDAVLAARKAVQQRPDLSEPHFFLAAALGHLGKLAEARASLEDCRRIRPDYVAQMRSWIKFRDDADLEHLFEGVRKAGWKA